MSDIIELAGLALLAVAVFLWVGLAACLAVVAVELVLIGVALDGIRLKIEIKRDEPRERRLRRVA